MGKVRITYDLPQGVKSFKYEPNTHFVELTDAAGSTIHLPAQAIMAHTCEECQLTWWTASNQCNWCPACSSQRVKRLWGKLQVAFVPTEESTFVPPEQSSLPTPSDKG